VTGDIFLDRIARSIQDVSPIEIHRDANGPPSSTLDVAQGITHCGDTMIMRTAVLVTKSGDVRWTSEWAGTNTDPMQDDLLREGYQAQQAVLDALTELGTSDQGAMIGLQAMQNAFSLDRDRARLADLAFQRAYQIAPHPAFLAWRAFLLTNQVIERQVEDAAGAAEEAVSLVWQAVRDAPDNSAVLAIASHVLRVMDEKPDLAAEFGHDALRLNPTTPLAWSSTANALITLGLAAKAESMAQRALSISRNSPFRFWWEMNACVAAVICGNAARGLYHAELAHRLNPSFRPPLRYLTALHLAENNIAPALEAARKLQALEPDFEVRLFHEPDYPAGTLRQSGIYKRMRQLRLPDLDPR